MGDEGGMTVYSEVPKKRYKTQPAPKCPVHGVLMFAETVTESIRYYRCPIPECDQRQKQVRKDLIL